MVLFIGLFIIVFMALILFNDASAVLKEIGFVGKLFTTLGMSLLLLLIVSICTTIFCEIEYVEKINVPVYKQTLSIEGKEDIQFYLYRKSDSTTIYFVGLDKNNKSLRKDIKREHIYEDNTSEGRYIVLKPKYKDENLRKLKIPLFRFSKKKLIIPTMYIFESY